MLKIGQGKGAGAGFIAAAGEKQPPAGPAGAGGAENEGGGRWRRKGTRRAVGIAW